MMPVGIIWGERKGRVGSWDGRRYLPRVKVWVINVSLVMDGHKRNFSVLRRLSYRRLQMCYKLTSNIVREIYRNNYIIVQFDLKYNYQNI